MNKKLYKCLAIILIFTMLLPVQLLAAASSDHGESKNTSASGGTIRANSDVSGHWAEKDFTAWQEKELITGYADGSFKPDQAINRAEFVTLVNRVFNFVEESEISFADVPSTSYFYHDIKKAVAAGYIAGYNDGTARPKEPISRQEAAVILYRVFHLNSKAAGNSSLTDIASLPEWSKTAVQTIVAEGYVNGYKDQTFKASKNITRAEAIRMMNNISGEILTKEGTYTNVSARNIVINKANITLKDTQIEGDLYLTEGIVEGDIILDNITVKGMLHVYGGGENSITIRNSNIADAIVDKKNGKLRIVTSGSTSVLRVIVKSGVKLEEDMAITGAGFGTVVIDEGAAPHITVELSGSFDQVEVRSLGAPAIKILKGIISKMILQQLAALHVDGAAEIKDIILSFDGKIKITGSGKVQSDSKNGAKIERDTAPSGGSSSNTAPTPTPSAEPVFKNVSVHDPSVIKVDGTYYVFGSHLAAAKTDDLMSWTLIDSGVTDTNKLFKSAESNVKKELAEALQWAESDTLWAADVIQLADGKFYMYYNACKGDQPLSAMGVGVADNIEGPYVNKGIFLKSGGSTPGYDGTKQPNVVDPDAFFDKEGKLWMVYGSYSGGIFILEMNPITGFPLEGQGYGKRLMGNNHSRIEAPYIEFNPTNNYYYLFVTFGGLGADGGYNMRVARSLSPDGPYVDYEGQDMIAAHGAAGSFFDDQSIEPYGVKLFGNFLYSNLNGEADFPTYGYVSPGHNSTYFDDATGKWFNIFHSRFPFRGEAHEVRVHQMFMNQDGWPVVAPHRYAGETIAQVSASDIVGVYQYINHGKDITKDIKSSQFVKLLADGTISGSVTGTWKLEDDYFAKLVVDEVVGGIAVQTVYKGVFIRQWDPTREAYVMAFTVMSGKGIAVWGSQFEPLTDQQMAANAVALLTLGNTKRIYQDVILPTKAANNWPITWESSNAAVVSASGVVTRPAAGSGNIAVQLTATITIGEEKASKVFTLMVQQEPDKNKPLEDGLIAQYDFENNLEELTGNAAAGTVTGNRINNIGGEITYAPGATGKGKAASFNGESGVLLPNGLISTNNYSVSMWLKPSEATPFTTTFFGAKSESSWISLVPRGPGDTQYSMLWSGEAWYDATTRTQIAVDKWTHVAFTVEDGSVKVYLNGVLKYEGTGFPNIFTDENGVFGLGVNYWNAPYKGLIDELRVYDVVLNAEKINWLVHGEPDLSVLVSKIQLDTSSKDLAKDTFFTPKLTILPENAGNKSVVWTSEDTSIAIVNASTGQVKGIGIGSTTITATAADSGQVTVSYRINVNDGLVAHYAFENNLSDTLNRVGAGSVTGDRIDKAGGTISYGPGITGDAAVFNGFSGIRLPDGLIDGEVYSVSMWLNPTEANDYSTTFFGARTTDSWISFVPRGPGSITMLWSGTDWYDGNTGMKISIGKWTHVVFTVDHGTVKIYINGVLKFSGTKFPNVFTNKNAVFGLGVNYWDKPFVGMMDELKIYSKVLTPEQIALQFEQTNMIILNVQSKSLVVGEEVSLTANRNVVWSSSDESVAVVNASGVVTAVAAGTATITSVSSTDAAIKAAATITVTASAPEFNELDGLLVKLDFNGNVKDSSGNGHDAAIKNGRVEYVDGRTSGEKAAQFLKATGGSPFDNIPVVLPQNLINGDQAYTVAAWVKWNGTVEGWSQAWSSIYFSDTFVSADNLLNYYLNFGLIDSTKLFIGSPLATSSNQLPVGVWTHVAMTVTPGGKTTVYLNGVEAAQVNSNVRTTQGFNEHFIGGNFWDQNFNGAMDEFRMYGKALTAEEIAILAGV
ncbi:beta-xylosidase [Paenibacillus castaneae]|uniref:LamG-like jellyroll fold domain-containing protein n=1 Tax=Paenibacillus castaneae TaxID=474957 RepID=UPI000C9C4C15|nr:LamG-like jellyroll fold domain-containing protein [Paenibacillus castaneae]NIK77236.1 beta-xylosidase [Paenibacillus castaneae]